MYAIKNQMHIWHSCFKSFSVQSRQSTSQSFSSTKPCVHLKSSSDHFFSVWSAPSHSCLMACLNKQIRGYPCLYSRSISFTSQQTMSNNPETKTIDEQEQDKLLSQMNMRLVNENNFLSWCRNAYLSSVVGVAMITEGTTLLAQSAGVGALAVGTMNLFWGTSCHIINLIRLRQVSGMSRLTLSLNLFGSTLHCLLWIFVLLCYIGFLDETNAFEQQPKSEPSPVLPNMEFQSFDNRPNRKNNEV